MQSGRSKRPSSLLVLLFAALVLLLMSGCESADAPDAPDELATQELESRGGPVALSCLLNQPNSGCTASWTILQQLPDGYPLTDVAGSSPSDVYVVGWQMPFSFFLPGGSRGRILNYDGAQWMDDTTGPRATLRAIALDDQGRRAVIVGTNGTIAERGPESGGGWRVVPNESEQDLNDVLLRPNGTGYAVGERGTLLEITRHGVTPITTSTFAGLNGIWGNGNIGIVGDEGTLLVYNKGTGITAIPTGTTRDLNAIWGNGNIGIWGNGNIGHPGNGNNGNANNGNGNSGIWGNGNIGIIVGEAGTILELRGGAVHEVPSPTTVNLNGIWGNGNIGIIVGDEGTVLIRTADSGGWQQLELRFNDRVLRENLTAVWGSSASDIFITSENGTVIHFGLR